MDIAESYREAIYSNGNRGDGERFDGNHAALGECVNDPRTEGNHDGAADFPVPDVPCEFKHIRGGRTVGGGIASGRGLFDSLTHR